MLVNWREREGRGTRAREVRGRGSGRLKARERGGGELRAKGRHGRPSISRPVLRSFPSAGKSSGWNTVVVVVEKRARWRGRNAPFVREMRRLCADNARSTSTYCVYSCASSAFRFEYLDLINPRISRVRLSRDSGQIRSFRRNYRYPEILIFQEAFGIH